MKETCSGIVSEYSPARFIKVLVNTAVVLFCMLCSRSDVACLSSALRFDTISSWTEIVHMTKAGLHR